MTRAVSFNPSVAVSTFFVLGPNAIGAGSRLRRYVRLLVPAPALVRLDRRPAEAFQAKPYETRALRVA